MGKDRKHQRVKGNVSSASSTQAQQAIVDFGLFHQIPEYVDFSLFSNSASGTSPLFESPSFATEVSFFSSSNPLPQELIVILKRLSKKNAQTKIKALDELQALLSERNDLYFEFMKPWSNFFNRLGIEYDKRIRLQAFSIHASLVSFVGKKLKSILKSVITTWMLGLYDPDVLSVAKSSFLDTFPLQKQEVLLQFCWSQLMQDLEGIIMKQTPETMSDPRYYTKEEMEYIYARSVSCAIQLSAFLCKLNPNIPYLQSIQFKDHIQSTHPHVRKAVALFVQSVIKEKAIDPTWIPYWLERFSILIWEEKHLTVAMEWWPTLLLLLKTIPDFYKSTTNDKLCEKLLKKVPLYITNEITKIPVAFVALPVFLNFCEEIPLDIVWNSAKQLATNTGKLATNILTPFWDFLIDLLKLQLKRKFDIVAQTMELMFGFLLKNEWSVAIPDTAAFLENLPKEILKKIEAPLLELACFHWDTISIPRLIDLLHTLNLSLVQENLSIFATEALITPSTSLTKFHASVHFFSSPGMELDSKICPIDMLSFSFQHCLECVQRAVSFTMPCDEEVMSLIISKPQYAVLDVLPFLSPYPSVVLTDFVLEHLNLQAMVQYALRHGYVDKEKIYETILKKNPQDLLSLNGNEINSEQLAVWCLLNCTKERWNSLSVKVDLTHIVLELLLNDTIEKDAWVSSFVRIDSPTYIFFSSEVLRRLRYTQVLPLRNRLLDSFEIDPSNLFSPVAAQKLLQLFQVHAIWEKSLEWQYFLALLGACCPEFDVPSLNIESDSSILNLILAKFIYVDECPPTTVDLFTLQILVQKLSLSPLSFLQLSKSHPRIHHHRVLSALLSGIDYESSILEVKRESWLTSFMESKDTEYLMLINAATSSSNLWDTSNEEVLLCIFDELIDTDNYLNFLQLALFFLLHPIPQSIPYCWFWLNHMDKSHPLSQILLNVTLQLMSLLTLENEEKHHLETYCKELWIQEELLSMDLSQFVSDLQSNEFEEQLLYRKLASEKYHVQFASFNLLRRKIGLKVQSMSLQLELVDFDEIAASCQINSLLLEYILKPPVSSVKEDHFQYLLSWILVFHHFVDATPRLRYVWIQSLQFSSLLNFLMEILSPKSSLYNIANWEFSEFNATLLSTLGTSEISVRNACAFLYFQALTLAPKYVRIWWNEIRDKQYKKKIESLTSSSFSPIILHRELTALRAPMESLKIKVIATSSVTQIQANYALEEHNIDLNIVVPAHYPLLPVDISGGKQVAISTGKWRSWILTCRTILSDQNASILDALKTFQSNIQLHLQGVSECSICFSIVGVSCNTLPNKACRTCKNKFHGACLYTWLRTSAQSTCPLCRSQF